MADLEIEKTYGNVIIAGVDEAGRGPLAGPVVAAAVIIDQQNIITGIRDSKKVSKKNREELYNIITANYCWSVGIISSEEVDQINILEATKKACKLAVSSMKVRAEIVIVDGNMKFDDMRFYSIIKGDDKSMSIAAASIVAKVTRDRIMEELSSDFPIYKWHKNSGYGTKDHIDAIVQNGRTIHHRKTFKVKGVDY
jgi:ribonuclease HII